ncbi:MAG: thiamine phosphate synthase [Thermoanaerobaculia bacterium]
MSSGAGLRPARIYAIADAEALAPRSLAEGAVAMAEAGILTIQLRAKHMEDRLLFAEAESCLRRLESWPGMLWIDDRVDLAMLLPFSGVHLGQSDIPATSARRLLAASQCLGLSTHDGDQLAAADRESAVDWVALGPIYPTRSKRNPEPVVGLEALRVLRARTAKPLVAIGGVKPANIGELLAAGADSVAVLSAICSGDVAHNCRELLAAAA